MCATASRHIDTRLKEAGNIGQCPCVEIGLPECTTLFESYGVHIDVKFMLTNEILNTSVVFIGRVTGPIGG